MNIQKTNMLLVNNKLKMKENQPAPMANPVSDEADQTLGMKALMLQGQQNYLNNNVAFHGGMKQKVAAYTTAALLGLGALATTSCQPDKEIIQLPPSALKGDSTVVNVSVVVNVDMSMMNAYLQQLVDQNKITNAELIALRADLNAWKEMYESDRVKWLEFMGNLYQRLDQMGDNQEVIISLLEMTGMSVEEIKAFLADLKAQGLSDAEIMEKILEKLGAIDEKLSNVVDILHSIDDKTGALLNTAEEINATGQATYNQVVLLGQQGDKTLQTLQLMYEKDNQILNAVQTLDQNNQKGFAAVTAAVAHLGITAKEIEAILIKQGWDQARIAAASVAQIVAAIKENTNATKGLYDKLNTIITLMKSGQISINEAAAQIIELLKSIDANVGQLLDVAKQTLNEVKAFRHQQAQGMAMLIQGQRINTMQLNALIALNAQEAESLKNLEEKGDTIIAKFDEVKTQGAGVDYDKLQEIANQLGLNIINANKETFEKALKAFLQAHKEDNDLLKAIYEKLGELAGTTINKDDLNAAVQKLVLAMNNNGDKISENITTEAENLKAELEKILAELKAIHEDMNKWAGEANKKWTKIEGYFDKVIELLTEGNANTAQLNVQFQLARTYIEKMQADLAKLEAAAEKIKDDEAAQVVLQTEIRDLIKNLKIDSSQYETIKELLEACKAKLIIIAEKEWKCECNCKNGNNEGIIEELSDITG